MAEFSDVGTSTTFVDTTGVSTINYTAGKLTLGDLHEWINHVLDGQQSGPGETDATIATTTTSIAVTKSTVTGY